MTTRETEKRLDQQKRWYAKKQLEQGIIVIPRRGRPREKAEDPAVIEATYQAALRDIRARRTA